jgi:hypothetical protein
LWLEKSKRGKIVSCTIKVVVRIKRAEEDIGIFYKNIEMPNVPPVGCYLHLGSSILPVKVDGVSYNEEESQFSTYTVIDIDQCELESGNHISNDQYPEYLVVDGGMSVGKILSKYRDEMDFL